MDKCLSRVQEIEEKFSVRKSRTTAKLDYTQSATGLILALFVWIHLILESSILLGKDTMYKVSKLLEGEPIFGQPYPIIVTIIAVFIAIVFLIHALVAIRKFPGSYKQYKIFKAHAKRMNHLDTKLWFYQIVTGFMLFFLASVHIFIVMTKPSYIGPYASSDRMVAEWMAPLYVLLLIAAVLHGTIGLYRLSVKWGWFEGKNPKKNRKILQKLRNILIVFFLTLGLLSIATYVKIGLEHKDNVGERYVPTYITEEQK